MGAMTADQTPRRPTTGARRHRVAIAAIGVAATTAAVVVVIHAFDPVYALPTGLVVAVIGAAVASSVAAGLAIRSARPDVAVLAAGTTFLFLLAIVGMLSIGIFVLPFAIAVLVVTIRRASSPSGNAGPALATGALMAVGLAFTALIAMQGPVVRCGNDGSVSTTTPLWWTGSSSTGSSSSHPVSGGSIEHRGKIQVGDKTARFECRDGTVTHFEIEEAWEN